MASGTCPRVSLRICRRTRSDAVSLDESDVARDARLLMARIVNALGVGGRLDVHEDDDAITLTCSGADVALLIGRHGQTIDAVQYL